MMAKKTAVEAKVQDALPQPRRFFSCGAVLLSICVLVLDSTMITATLPSITSALQISERMVAWLVSGYQLAVVLSVLPAAAIGERWGYHRLFRAGLVLFLCGAVLCSFSSHVATALVGRALQGTGAGAVYATMATILRYSVPPHRMGRAISNNALMVGIAASMGPSIGIYLISHFDWRILFLATIPFIALSLAFSAALPLIPRGGMRMQLIPALASIVCLGSLVMGIDSLPATPLRSIFLFGLAAISGWFLYRIEKMDQSHFVPFDLLSKPTICLAAFASTFMFMSQLIANMAMPFFMQRALEVPLAQMAGILAFWPIGVIVISLMAGWLSDRFTTGTLAASGSALLGATLLCLSAMGPLAVPFLPVFCFFCGVGFGMFQSPNNRAMLLGVPKSRTAGAGAVQALARQVGYSSGAAATAGMFTVMPGSDGRIILFVGSVMCAVGLTASLIRRSADLSEV